LALEAADDADAAFGGLLAGIPIPLVEGEDDVDVSALLATPPLSSTDALASAAEAVVPLPEVIDTDILCLDMNTNLASASVCQANLFDYWFSCSVHGKKEISVST
jgi:hypothetical protein